jgi:hypothetical protein
VVYRKSLKYVLNLNKNTPSDWAYHIAGVVSPEMLSNIRYLGVASRLLLQRGLHLEPWIRNKITIKIIQIKAELGLEALGDQYSNKDLRNFLVCSIYRKVGGQLEAAY